MEIVLALSVVIAVPVVIVAAKRGAEAAQRERERRWGQVPAGPPERRWAQAVGRDHRPGPGPVPPRLEPAGSPFLARPAAPPAARTRRAVEHGAGSATALPEAPPPASSPSSPPSRPPAPPPRAPERSGRGSAGMIDVNAASVEELTRLPGVGIRAAERIVAHRERHGPFASLGDVASVDGFDRHRVSRLAPHATV